MKNSFFPAFGNILVSVVAFSFQKICLKGNRKICFHSFWQYLGFSACFFRLSALIKKVIENLIFPDFGNILGFGGCFFLN